MPFLPSLAGHHPLGILRNERTADGIEEALGLIGDLKDRFGNHVKVTGRGEELNQPLERAGRVADFFEQAELMCIDAWHRAESCGAHFRSDSKTDEGEVLRQDEDSSSVAAGDFTDGGTPPRLHHEDLDFENVELQHWSDK